ncbi:MAG: GAP family protein, partial [Candidatus Dormibacteraeota bacterium]|nr:GAP family protein [Candidatus Dormibacteraeota bacterium]
IGTNLAPTPIGEIARFALGAIALGAGIWTWLSRSSERSTSPARWMGAVGRITPTRSAALGFALSAGPKSLVLLAGGGLAIAGVRTSWAGEALAGVVFVAVASSTALVPVVLYYALGKRALNWLHSVHDWMQLHSAAVSAVLLILVGVVLIGSGISGLGGL